VEVCFVACWGFAVKVVVAIYVGCLTAWTLKGHWRGVYNGESKFAFHGNGVNSWGYAVVSLSSGKAVEGEARVFSEKLGKNNLDVRGKCGGEVFSFS
jgi:hypothetical protein